MISCSFIEVLPLAIYRLVTISTHQIARNNKYQSRSYSHATNLFSLLLKLRHYYWTINNQVLTWYYLQTRSSRK